MAVQLYLKKITSLGYEQLDLFDDEKIELNINVKNINDISKIRSDFTQAFSIPSSPKNNQLFEYWYNADVDGEFNANIRVDAYIEINSQPFKFGSLQLEKCKLKYLKVDSYQVTFYGLAINLSDKFGDDLLKNLPLSQFNHVYNQANIISAIQQNSINNGDIYYPLINYRTFMDIGNGLGTDLINSLNTISYKDFKPALRELRIIEAIEEKYNVIFTRDFFDRSIFYNKYMALHKESGRLKTYSEDLLIDYTSKNTTEADWTIPTDEINLTNNSFNLNFTTGFPSSVFNNTKFFKLVLNTTIVTGLSYKIDIYDNGILFESHDNLLGNSSIVVYQKLYSEDNTNRLFTFKVSSIEGNITFNTQAILIVSYQSVPLIGSGSIYRKRVLTATSVNQTTFDSYVKIVDQMPDMKVKDYFNNLINIFNLVLIPRYNNTYYIDTLDNWYSKGKVYDINNYIDIKDTEVKKPIVKKLIDFKYQKTDTVLGKTYFDNNQKGYGDLKARYNVDGDEMKIESTFENLVFERLQNETTSALSELHAGYVVNIENKPVKGKPLSFYRNGTDEGTTIYISGVAINKTIHTATEDNKILSQVTNSLNFGDENSTYLYSPISTGLYFNFWKTYIEDLFNRKCRVLPIKIKIPTRILYNLQLNDRFVIGDKKYKISSLRVNLTNNESVGEVFTDFSSPSDSLEAELPITVDNDIITVDNSITVDTISIYNPTTSYTINGVSITTYTASKGEENFELKIESSQLWNAVSTQPFVEINKTSGKKTDHIRVKVNPNTGGARTAYINVTIGLSLFTITINQL
jgi:hypothetical protein